MGSFSGSLGFAASAGFCGLSCSCTFGAPVCTAPGAAEGLAFPGTNPVNKSPPVPAIRPGSISPPMSGRFPAPVPAEPAESFPVREGIPLYSGLSRRDCTSRRASFARCRASLRFSSSADTAFCRSSRASALEENCDVTSLPFCSSSSIFPPKKSPYIPERYFLSVFCSASRRSFSFSSLLFLSELI